MPKILDKESINFIYKVFIILIINKIIIFKY